MRGEEAFGFVGNGVGGGLIKRGQRGKGGDWKGNERNIFGY